MITEPNITGIANRGQIDGVVVHLVVINMVYVKRAALFFSRFATVLTHMAIAVTNHALELARKFRTIRKSCRTAIPAGIIWSGECLRNLFSCCRTMLLAKKRVLFPAYVTSLIGPCCMIVPLFGISSLGHALSRRPIVSVVFFAAALSPFLYGRLFLGYSFMRFRCLRIILSFVPWARSWLKSGFLAARIVAVRILSGLILGSYWGNERSASAFTWNLRQLLSSCLLTFSIPPHSFVRYHVSSVPHARGIT